MRKPKIRIYDTKKREFGGPDYDDILRLQILVHNLTDQGFDIAMINLAAQPDEFNASADMKALYASSGDSAFRR